jgi:Tfp pilus assembly protein PilX
MIRYCLTFLKRKNSLDTKNINQAGFALPVAIGMGLVMIIVAASMIGRAQSGQIITNSQRETSRALSTSEAGIIRVQSFLDRHKLLATKNLSEWSNTLKNLPTPQASCRLIDLISTKQQTELFKNNNWINLDNRDQNKGRYKIIDYQYRDGIGKLTVSGEIDTYNTNQNSAKSTLTVEIPIGNESAKIAPPALWANTFNLNPNQKVTGQIQAAACPQLPAIDLDGIIGVDASNITLISGVTSGQIVADPFIPIPAPKIAPATATPLPAITASIQLPRLNSIDTPDANGEYHYLVDIDNESSGHSIKLKDLDTIKIDVTATQKVNLYLKGNIDLAGSQTLNVNPTHPNLRIYGSAQTLKFSIKDNASITAFIHAPFADAKSISSDTPNPNKNITGGLWVNSWDSATSPTEIPIIQAGNWADFGIAKIEQPAQISPVSSWQRVGN